jgi:hypothetical protein
VFGGLNRLFVAALVAGVALAAPSAALACNGGPSAVNVYKECLPTGGGGKSSGGGGGGGGGKPSGGGSQTGSTSTPVTHVAKKAIKHAPAKERRVMYSLVKDTSPRRLQLDKNNSSSAAATPSAIGSAFDLGSGPTALLVVLAATAFLLLAATGLRGVRQRRR